MAMCLEADVNTADVGVTDSACDALIVEVGDRVGIACRQLCCGCTV